ncbi:putative ribosome-binding factor A, mitochondrial [Sorex fumeus]|uniref:putative ribosome-binding factor A, mitochondrial n=1 Tax=Sorex fumeus TaxID=62283 RepID=UPI0024AE13EC|nr:putative ribosome-binding factor A, mitochondrial [Sorex fumeus]
MWAAARGPWASRPGLGAWLGCGLWGLQPRALHGSPAACGKNLLKKFASRTRKKFWYEGPSLGSHLTQKPSQPEFLTKSSSKKTKKEDHIRQKALNGLLYKALTDLLCTPEVSQEVYDLNVELSKVSLTSDFSACRVYWKSTLSAEQNTHTQAVLQRSAAHMRRLLLSLQTLRNIPPIVFVQDKGNAALAEVDKLLAAADFGPPEEKEDFAQSNFRDTEAPSRCAPQAPPAYSSLYGIDHETLNKQIMEYKRRKEKGQGRGSGCLLGPPHTAEQTGQLHKRKKKARSRVDLDGSPRGPLWRPADEHYLDAGGGAPEEYSLGYEWEGPEAEPEAERKGQKGGSD